mgnify:CR=1 FL=1|nr:MAG TPA: hypothetical protein [Caudoviricetes sp.]
MNVKNIAVAGMATIFAGTCVTMLLKHHATKMEDDFEEMSQILNDIDTATDIEEVTGLMHRATELFGRHDTLKEFYDLNAEILDRGTKRACELLEDADEKKEA